MSVFSCLRMSALLALGFAVSTSAVTVDPAVTRALKSNAFHITVLAHLSGQYDLKNAPASGKELSALLEKYNKRNADPILRALKAGNPAGIKSVSYLWITNSLRITGTPEAITKLLSVNALEAVEMDKPKEFTDLGTATASAAVTDEPNISWGVKKVRAPELWNSDAKIDGTGVLVAMVDSGANLTHPDLAPNLWRNPGETGTDSEGRDRATNGVDDDSNGYVDDVVGWNFEEKNNDPTDVNGHGSQTAGVVAGKGTGGTQTGVAPGAKMMIIRTCCNVGTAVFESITWEGLQYALKNGAKVISMSLSVKHPSKPSYAKWRRLSEVILAAGVVHVNSAGNRGSGNTPFNIGAPASNPPAWMHPKQPFVGGLTSMITIGATDTEDKILEYSSQGPVTWESIEEYKDYPYEEGAKAGLIRPDVCGPSEVPSTSMEGTGYTEGFNGTSAATPNVAGVVALLLSAKPNLTPAQVTETLQMSSILIDGEFNNKCGAGRVDAVAAVEYARSKF